MDDTHQRPIHEWLTDLDFEILDALRENAQSTEVLAETLSRGGEHVGEDDARGHLEMLASYGLAGAPREAPHHDEEADADEPVAVEEADEGWEITEEGRAVVEPRSGASGAPRDRGFGHDEEDDDRDVAGLVVLLLIGLVTGMCATYTLLTVTGVLGGG
jgi:hypothetical protein